MKTLGLIGGMSWESSAQYYRLINEAVRHRLGGAHSAQLLLWSVDFAGISSCSTTAAGTCWATTCWTPHGGCRPVAPSCW